MVTTADVNPASISVLMVLEVVSNIYAFTL